MSFRSFLEEVRKGLQEPVYLLISKDFFLQREALRIVKNVVPADERDFNLHVFDTLLDPESIVSFSDIIELVNTGSFFGKRRYTIYSGNIQRLSNMDINKIIEYMRSPMTESTFVILNYGVVKKDILSKLKNVKVINLDIKESEVPNWVKDMARMKGCEISDEAINYLIGFIGTEPGLLSSEIDKIAFLGKKKVNVEDLSDIITGGSIYNNFDLVNALIRKKTFEVFKIYNSIKDFSDNYSLIGSLNWQYTRLFEGEKDKEISYKIFELLHNADVDIKSSGREFPTEYLLFKLIKLQEERLPFS